MVGQSNEIFLKQPFKWNLVRSSYASTNLESLVLCLLKGSSSLFNDIFAYDI